MDASDAILKTLDSLNSQLKANHIAIAGQLKIIDTRLALIEQRLTNMEAFVPVDNTPHIYQHTEFWRATISKEFIYWRHQNLLNEFIKY